MTDVERRVRAMTKPERRAYLLAAGWTRIGDTWLHPNSRPVRPGPWFYSLAAAIRTAVDLDVITADAPKEEQP